MEIVNDAGLDILFRKARTFAGWQDKPVPETLIRAIYDLLRMGPTAANCQPGRYVFVTTSEAKERLKPCLAPGNVDKTMAAPVTAIIAYDQKFYDHLPEMFPPADAKSWYEGDAAFAEETAFRNATLQGGYFILAARALGLDCGPMSGFDPKAVQEAFFSESPDTKVTLLCNVGYGDRESLHPRLPRFDFERVAEIV